MRVLDCGEGLTTIHPGCTCVSRRRRRREGGWPDLAPEAKSYNIMGQPHESRYQVASNHVLFVMTARLPVNRHVVVRPQLPSPRELQGYAPSSSRHGTPPYLPTPTTPQPHACSLSDWCFQTYTHLPTLSSQHGVGLGQKVGERKDTRQHTGKTQEPLPVQNS